MEKLYSSIFVVDISQNPDEVETVSSRVQQLIEDHGGVIKNIDRWGKRRLTYQVGGKTHGYYVEIEFTANSHLNIQKTLEDEFRLNDRVLRHMTYIVDKKELIERARTVGKKKQQEEAEVKAAQIKSEERAAETVPEKDEAQTKIVEKEEQENAETSEENEAAVEEESKKKSEKQE